MAAAPGPINPPVIFEPGPDLSGNSLEVWIIGSGGPNWGGAQIHVSFDDSTYGLIGFLIAGASQGVLSAPFSAGADPDTVNTLSIDLSMSRGALVAGTEADADLKLTTLCYCDTELIAFSAATLTGLNTYDLDTYIRRGCYGTRANSHAAGSQFAWIQNPYNYEYPASLVGKTVFFKFVSFNLMGGAPEDLADCVAYPYTLTGAGIRPGTGPGGAGGWMLPLVTGEYTDIPVGGPTADILLPVPITDGRGQYIGVPL